MYRVQTLDRGPRVLSAVRPKTFLSKPPLCVCHCSNRFMSMKSSLKNRGKKLVIIITNSKLNLKSKVARTVKTFFPDHVTFYHFNHMGYGINFVLSYLRSQASIQPPIDLQAFSVRIYLPFMQDMCDFKQVFSTGWGSLALLLLQSFWPYTAIYILT